MNKSPRCTIGKESRLSSRDIQSPGPANYVLNPLNSKGFTIAKSIRKLHDIIVNPGPEAYHNFVKESSPRYTIPKAKL